MILTKQTEAKAWRAALEAGVDLPDELVAMWDRLAGFEAEQRALTAEQADVVPAPTGALRGLSISDAAEAERRDTAAAELLEAKRRTAGRTIRMLADQIGAWIAAHRDLLIVEHLRPVVASIIDEADPLARQLKDFAPTFDAAQIAADATPTQIKAWRASRELNDFLGVCIDAWVSSWKSATSSTPGNYGVAGYLRFDAPGGLHVWERPESIEDLDVRDGRTTDVLRIALNADAGYRLAGGQEMLDLTQRVFTIRPHVVGELNARMVLLPGEPPKQAIPEVRRVRAVFQ